jgi:hypothetical protein
MVLSARASSAIAPQPDRRLPRRRTGVCRDARETLAVVEEQQGRLAQQVNPRLTR